MNWGAGVLLLLGGAVVVIGVTKSQQGVCQAISGSPCTWLTAPTGTETAPGLQGPAKTGVASGTDPLANIVNSCFNSTSCSSYMTTASNDASTQGIDPVDFVRQIAQESGFNPNAKSSAGAEGIAQLMPSTASAYGVNPYNPTASLQVASSLMGGYENYWQNALSSSQYGFSGNSLETEALALSSYNYGFGGTQNLAKTYGVNWMQHAPSQTKTYISTIQFPNTPQAQ